MAQSKAATRWRLLTGAMVGIAIVFFFNWKQPFAESRIDFPLQLAAAYFLSVGLHEADHAVAAFLVGFRLVILADLRGDKRTSYLCGLYKAQAAIALLEHRWTDVQSAAHEALKQCDRFSDPGIAIAIRDKVEALLADRPVVRA